MDVEDRVRGYVREVVGARVAEVTRFEEGDRHDVFKAVCHDATAVVVRISTADDEARRLHAETEAAVLERLDGTGAPRLYDFRSESEWFAAPVMCIEYVDGSPRDLASASLNDIERLGAVVGSVHDLPVGDLADRLPGPATIRAYVEQRLELNESYKPRLRRPLPPPVASRVEHAFAWVAASAERARMLDSFDVDDRLVLLHGDVGPGNILWSPEPVLIDWEYARLGDPADEVAYIFGQHGLSARQREAFWNGYRPTTARTRFDHLAERARWWEPVLLLASALWWLERWSRRADADAEGISDPAAPKPQDHYVEQAARRLDRFDGATSTAEFD